MSLDRAAVLDVAKAAERALRLIEGMDQNAFDADERTRWAVYSQFVLIGEAAARVSPAFRKSHAGLPWKEMVGMRNRLVHGYDQIDWSRVWETLQQNLPALLKSLASVPGDDDPVPD